MSDVGENKIILACGLIREWGTKCGKTLLYALLRSSLDSVAGVHLDVYLFLKIKILHSE